MKQIAELKRESRAKRPLREQKVAQAIQSIIPDSQEFTRADILKALQTAAPERRWASETVKRELTALQQRGMIRKLRTQSWMSNGILCTATRSTRSEWAIATNAAMRGRGLQFVRTAN